MNIFYLLINIVTITVSQIWNDALPSIGTANMKIVDSSVN